MVPEGITVHNSFRLTIRNVNHTQHGIGANFLLRFRLTIRNVNLTVRTPPFCSAGNSFRLTIRNVNSSC